MFNVGARILGIRLPRGRLYEMPTVCRRHFDVVVAVGEQPDAWPWPTIVRIDGLSVEPARSFDVEQVALDVARQVEELWAALYEATRQSTARALARDADAHVRSGWDSRPRRRV